MKQRYTYIFLVTLVSFFVFSGWGKDGHKKINGLTTIFFPSEMSAFVSWSSSLASHGSDADYRRDSDPNEDKKHYIDIDTYYSFVTTGKISQKLADANQNEGILPWATIAAFDSLKANFQRKDWDKAILTASDLGHYVADGHQPLHITKNYNGQLTGQTGIHTPRYESTMISKFYSQIIITKDTISYISNVPDFVFNYIYSNYPYVDSVLAADKYATAKAGNTTSDAYYQALWDKSKDYTNLLFNNAAKRLAALIYTAWTDAGKPQLTTAFAEDLQAVINGFEVYQNFPNPFNPETRIKFSTPVASKVMLKVFDASGKEVKTILNKEMPAGLHEYSFNAQALPSGVYFYNISFGSQSITKKMLLVK